MRTFIPLTSQPIDSAMTPEPTLSGLQMAGIVLGFFILVILLTAILRHFSKDYPDLP